MPRRSAASLALDPFLSGPSRLQPPLHLTAAERAVWVEITSTVPSEHFKPEDSHLLEAYCTSVVHRRQAAAEMVKAGTRYDRVRSPWCEQHLTAIKALRTLSIALRLGPMARHPVNRRRDSTVLDRQVSAYEFLGDGGRYGIMPDDVRTFDDLHKLQKTQATEAKEDGSDEEA